jgi:hypothetical protein
MPRSITKGGIVLILSGGKLKVTPQMMERSRDPGPSQPSLVVAMMVK